MVEAICAGHICVDLIPEFPIDAGRDVSAYLAPGRLSEVGPMPLATGGSVSNTGLNLKRLGIDTRLMGKISDDLLGRAILEIVRRYGPELAEAMIVVPDETSSYTIVISPPHIDRMFLHCPGANHTFGASDVRFDLVAKARVFHFGYPPYLGRMYADGGQEMIEMFRRAKATGVTTSLDMAMPDPSGPSGKVNWLDILGSTLPYVDLFLPSVEEWLFVVDRERFEALTASVGPAGMLHALEIDDIRALGRKALQMGVQVAVLKLGERGIYMRTAPAIGYMGRGEPEDLASWQDQEMWVPAFIPGRLVGTTGAGDATIAGFLAALLRDFPPARALTIAAAVGACNVEAADALSGVRTWEETLARIDAGWAQRPLTIEGWRVDHNGVWHCDGQT
jgi:sugar/nucleoside kinase (ribokinase family)